MEFSKETYYIFGQFGFVVEAVIYSHSVDFTVYEVTSRELTGEILKKEMYLHAYIKWDTCSHFIFGEEENGKSNGYLHLCGYEDMVKHVLLIQWLYEKAKELMPDSQEFDDWDWQEILKYKEENI